MWIRALSRKQLQVQLQCSAASFVPALCQATAAALPLIPQALLLGCCDMLIDTWMILSHCIEEALEVFEQQQERPLQQQQQVRRHQQQQMRAAFSNTVAATGKYPVYQILHSTVSSYAWLETQTASLYVLKCCPTYAELPRAPIQTMTTPVLNLPSMCFCLTIAAYLQACQKP
jgi:hypothetical protein